MQNSIFYDKLPNWVEKTCIVFMMCAQMMVSGISANVIGPVTAFLGDEKDNIQFTFYGGIIASMAIYPIVMRIMRYFRVRQILLYGIALELIVSILSVYSHNDFTLFVTNYLLSSIKMTLLIVCLILYMRKYNLSNSRGKFYGSYYVFSFSLSQLYSYLVAILLQSYSWRYTFLISIPGLFVSLFIVLFLLHSNRMSKKYPFYQIDWIGYLLFVIPSLFLAFGCIFGERLYWFQNKYILFSFALSIVGYVVLGVRLLTAKRPLFDLRVYLKYSHIRWGILYMFLMFFIYNTFAISTEFMKVNLHYNDEYVARTNLYMIVGFMVFIPLTGVWLHKVHRVRESLFVGFALFALYYFYTAHVFYPEENEGFFFVPMMLRAAAYGISLTSLSYYASVNVAPQDSAARAMFSISTRSVIAAPITSAFWQSTFNNLKTKFLTIVSSPYTEDDYRVSGLWKNTIAQKVHSGQSIDVATQLAEKGIRNNLYQQALILSAQNIYYILAAVSLVLAVSVLFLKVFNIHYVAAKNKYPLTVPDP